MQLMLPPKTARYEGCEIAQKWAKLVASLCCTCDFCLLGFNDEHRFLQRKECNFVLGNNAINIPTFTKRKQFTFKSLVGIFDMIYMFWILLSAVFCKKYFLYQKICQNKTFSFFF